MSIGICISSSFSANKFTKPTRQRVKAKPSGHGIVAQEATPSPSMILRVSHRVISQSLDIESQILQRRELRAVDDGMRRYKVIDVGSSEVDGDGSRVKGVEELLGDVAVSPGVLNGEDELVV